MINGKTVVYLSGGITGLNINEANDWRADLCIQFERVHSKCYVFNPVEHFNPDNPLDYESEKEVMDYELNILKKSDFVIVNFNAPKSLGTMSEIAIAYNLGIPVIGLNEKGIELHPWQNDFCTRIFSNIDDLSYYVIQHYLNF